MDRKVQPESHSHTGCTLTKMSGGGEAGFLRHSWILQSPGETDLGPAVKEKQDSQNAATSLESQSELGLPLLGLTITLGLVSTSLTIPVLEQSVALEIGHVTVSRTRNCSL